MDGVKFENQVALITGGTSGIGLAVAERLLHEGGKVVIVGRNKERGNSALEKLKQISPHVLFLSVDVSKGIEVEQMVKETVNTFGSIDFAFNNAGNAEGTPALTHEFSEENFDHMMGSTIKGVWLCMKYELQAMIENGGGSIVNTSSLDALICSAYTTAYAAGKSGILALTRGVAQEYGNKGIRVNAITPGAIRTPMMERKFENLTEEQSEMLEERYNSLNALGRMGTSSEAADVVTWLFSKESSFVTGQNIIVDGGVSIVTK